MNLGRAPARPGVLGRLVLRHPGPDEPRPRGADDHGRPPDVSRLGSDRGPRVDRAGAHLPGKGGRWAAGVLALLLIVLTARRNRDYGTEIGLWTDTIAKRPDNVFARENLGGLYFHSGRPQEAIAEYREALARQPDYPEAENNWGMVLASLGQNSEAIGHYERAVALKKDYPEGLNNWGIALSAEGRGADAVEKLQEALRLKPDYPEAENNLGLAYARQGDWPEAIRHYEIALQSRPEVAEFEENLGLAFAYSGKVPEGPGPFPAFGPVEPPRRRGTQCARHRPCGRPASRRRRWSSTRRR